MKTFKQLVNEVAEPKAGDEKRFKAKHVVAKYPHPAAEDEQFASKKAKDKSKRASYEDGEDEDVYEEAQPKWKVAIGKKHYTVVGRNTAEASKKAQMMANKEGNRGVPGKVERLSEEVEQIDELSKKTLGSYIKKAKTDVAGKAYQLGAKDPLKPKASWSKTMSRERNIDKAVDRLTKEEVELDETFKMGSMKLKDGKTVTLSKEEADAVNNLFNELNASNKKRMQEEMMKDKSGFDKVLKFAKEAL